MHYGSLIKYHRIQRNMTQKELASGICSIPHLSKIENNYKEVNEETLKLLFDRLHIDLEEASGHDKKILSLVDELYEQISYQLHGDAKATIIKLEELNDLAIFSSSIYAYQLAMLRAFIYLGDYRKAGELEELLSKQTKNFTGSQLSLFHFIRAVGMVKQGRSAEAMPLLEVLAAEKKHGIDYGEVCYHLSIVKTTLGHSVYAIHYANLALQEFKAKHNFIRILHTLMLLGIHYTETENYSEAHSCYEHLIRNAKLLNERALLGQVYHNLGYLQEKTGETELALESLSHSLELQDAESPQAVVTRYTIGEIHYSLNDFPSAKRLFEEVRSLAASNGHQLYELLSQYYLLAIDEPGKSLQFLETKVIPYVEARQSHLGDLRSFYKLLSKHYKKAGKTEKAVSFLEKIS